MYKLKQIPEDFLVTEISSIPRSDNGRYHYYKLKKKNRNTIDAVKQLAKTLGIKEKQIGFAGNKDRNAVTEQIISIIGVNKEKISSIALSDMSLEFIGYADKPISLGDLNGNAFEIVVRNLDDNQITNNPISFCENYFDEQRFSKNNVEIGKMFLKKNFEKAVELIDHPVCLNHLKKFPKDFVGAIRRIPIRSLRIYVNAYQSMLWNKTVVSYLERHCSVVKKVPYSQGELVFVKDKIDLKVPIVGFDSRSLESGEIKQIIVDLLKKEEMEYSDFLIKQIPQLSLEGELRTVFIDVNNFVLGKSEDDELNFEKKKIKISFTLPKGSYATMVVKKVF
ncbi:MAG: tRNA pseudouridine(13) synthase TruD [archaeon]|nr:tRNA pseudouridine(13) synthase TruD [archaeon]